MKILNTNLTEKQFLSRLEVNCHSKTPFDRGYNDSDTFVYKIKDNRFWLGKHYRCVGRTDGFASAKLNCKYDIASNGRITVTYRRAKHPIHVIFHSLAFTIGLYFSVDSLINVFKYGETNEWIFPLAFLFIGLFGLLIKPNKEWCSLEKHLHNICNM